MVRPLPATSNSLADPLFLASMTISIAHLGPRGTYAEMAALTFAQSLSAPPLTGGSIDQLLQNISPDLGNSLAPYPSIPRTLQAVAEGATTWAVVPVENSIEGGVSATLDSLWQLPSLFVHRTLILPIRHAYLSFCSAIDQVETIYSHPQALAQCQGWIADHCPEAECIPMNSTTEAAQRISQQPNSAAIASRRAANLYDLPVLAYPINDYPDNCTRFWVVSTSPSQRGSHTALAFSLPANRPGALVQVLNALADQSINLSRIESRPSKRSLGDYLFFIDLDASLDDANVEKAIATIKPACETFRILGGYDIVKFS
jgi:prephenate dehydratase